MVRSQGVSRGSHCYCAFKVACPLPQHSNSGLTNESSDKLHHRKQITWQLWKWCHSTEYPLVNHKLDKQPDKHATMLSTSTSYQLKLLRKRTFHHFMSTGATEKSLHFYLQWQTRIFVWEGLGTRLILSYLLFHLTTLHGHIISHS